MSAGDPAGLQLAEQLVRRLADAMGVNIDPEQAVALAARAVTHVGDLIGARAWRDAREAGDQAASKITTLEQAETSARKPR